jgi:hypothetical protein
MIIIPKKTTAVLSQNRLAIGCVFHTNDLMVIADRQNPARISLRADKRPLPLDFGDIAIPPRLVVFVL